MTTTESRNHTKDTIKINERYELRYFLSSNIPSKQFGSGKWPIHVHKPSGGLYMFIGASIEDVTNVFIKYASEIMSNKDLEDLKISLKKLPFREMP